MLFLGPKLHPSSALIVWLAAVLAVQFIGYGGVGVLMIVVLLSATKVFHAWLRYIARTRWLLVTLWFVIAYSTSGEAVRDLSWAPTYEGINEANMQVARLSAMLACLAWLLVRLGLDGLVSALWGLLQPLQRVGGDPQRLVVRLSLVLDNLQVPPEKGSWRRILVGGALSSEGPETLRLSSPRWMVRDALIVVTVLIVLFGVIIL